MDDQAKDGEIILKLISKKDMMALIGFVWLKTGTSGRLVGSIICGEFLDQLRNYQLLKRDSAPWTEWVT